MWSQAGGWEAYALGKEDAKRDLGSQAAAGGWEGPSGRAPWGTGGNHVRCGAQVNPLVILHCCRGLTSLRAVTPAALSFSLTCMRAMHLV